MNEKTEIPSKKKRKQCIIYCRLNLSY